MGTGAEDISFHGLYWQKAVIKVKQLPDLRLKRVEVFWRVDHGGPLPNWYISGAFQQVLAGRRTLTLTYDVEHYATVL